MQILTVSGLQKTYTTRFGGSKVQALKNVNFTVESGEYVAIMGESGSGKTTLLNILAALDKPTGGTVLLGGKNLSEIPEETAAAFRRDNLGFVFQDFSLLDTFSLEDNICLPLVLAGKSRTEMRDRLSPLAYDLGIETLLKKYPYEVSGGQKQRAAVARALITRPQILLADEPTGALDSRSTDELLKLFGEINASGQTIVMARTRIPISTSVSPMRSRSSRREANAHEAHLLPPPCVDGYQKERKALCALSSLLRVHGSDAVCHCVPRRHPRALYGQWQGERLRHLCGRDDDEPRLVRRIGVHRAVSLLHEQLSPPRLSP